VASGVLQKSTKDKQVCDTYRGKENNDRWRRFVDLVSRKRNQLKSLVIIRVYGYLSCDNVDL